MNLKTSFSIIRQWLWLIILCAMTASSSAYISGRLQPGLYTAISKVELNQKKMNQHRITDSQHSQQEKSSSQTDMQLFQSPDLVESLQEEFGNKVTILQLSITPETDKGLLFVQVDSDNAQAAAFIANHLPQKVHEEQLEQETERYIKANENLNKRLETLAQDISDTKKNIIKLEASSNYNHSELERQRGVLSLQDISYQMLYQNLSLIEQAQKENGTPFQLVEAATIPKHTTHPYLFQNTLLAAMIGSFIGASAGFLAEYQKKKREIRRAIGEDASIWQAQKSSQLHRSA